MTGPLARPIRLITRPAVLLVALTVVTAFPGCVFDTREPVPPGGPPVNPECQFSNAVDPAEVLRNVEQAFDCATQGIDTFEKSHAEDFDMNPSPLEDEAIRSEIDAWQSLSPPREGVVGAFTQRMNNLGSRTAQLTIAAESGDEVQADDGVVFEDVAYTLTIRSGNTVEDTFGGQADIYIRQGENTYVIYRWDDANLGQKTLAQFWIEGTGGGP